MMRSMYSGVSGLKNHQVKMDVIGNNIANVNTVGYKKSRVVFKDTLYQTFRGASSPTTARGGTNPMGIGLGVTVSSVEQLHLGAPAMTTNKSTDMAIDGNGYFMVKNGNQNYFTRAGSFIFDEQDNLVNGSGLRVAGWVADKALWDADGYKINTTPEASAISIAALNTLPPIATTKVNFTGNLSSKNTTIVDIPTATPPFTIASLLTGTPPAASSSIDNYTVGEGDYDNKVITSREVYDSLGNKQNVYYKFFKTADATGAISWHSDVSLDPTFSGTVTAAAAVASPAETAIPTNGVLRLTNVVTFKKNGTVNTSVKPMLTINRDAYQADPIKMEANFSKLTQYEPKSDAKAATDGYATGSLTSYSVGTDGTISAEYNNGLVRAIARVATYSFANPSGLAQSGSTLFSVSSNSGDPVKGAPGEQGMGVIVPNSLEMSNVDLSEEFTDMITTQRGFQANSRTITTTDEMIQELVNLKR